MKVFRYARDLRALSVATLILGGLAAPAHATPILVNQWVEFGFAKAPSQSTGCRFSDQLGKIVCPQSLTTQASLLPAAAWTYRAPAGGSTLTVTDAFRSNDRFELFDFGVSLGLTSHPFRDRVVDCGADPAACLASPGISHGVFSLAAGDHRITVVPVFADEGQGTGFVRINEVNAVPEPASLLLVATGLGYLSFRARRQRPS